MVITVTTTSDATNGTVSSVAELMSSPGRDGISLREALEVTNNDPGLYTIRFAAALARKTIRVGSSGLAGLPRLTGGGVFVNGDINTDGQPDVTLLRAFDPATGFGLTIASSGNRLHALTVRDFEYAVGLIASGTGRTYSNNVVSRMVMKNVHKGGIAGFGGTRGDTHSRWVGTRLIGNTIESGLGGIELFQQYAGEVVDGITIADNSIRIHHQGHRLGDGIRLVSGAGASSNGNRLSDVLIADNSIEGNATNGIGLVSGQVGAKSNTVQRVRIVGNRVRLEPAVGVAINVVTGDGATDFVYPKLRPIRYPDGNRVRDVEISRNTVVAGTGVGVFGGCCGAARNTVRDVRVSHNVIRTSGPFAGVLVDGGGDGNHFSRASTRNVVSNLTIEANRITTVRPGSLTPDSGAIVLRGGRNGRANEVKDARITNNRVDTRLIGISLIGGFGDPGDPPPPFGAMGNVVVRISVRGNRVLRAPMVTARFEPRTKGISLVGGAFRARGNRVTCVRMSDNTVAGVRNDISVVANVSGASGNTASLKGC